MTSEPVRIDRLRVGQIDTLERLWLTLHQHHQRAGADLSPYVDDTQSWRRRREFYLDCFAQPGSSPCEQSVSKLCVASTLATGIADGQIDR